MLVYVVDKKMILLNMMEKFIVLKGHIVKAHELLLLLEIK